MSDKWTDLTIARDPNGEWVVAGKAPGLKGRRIFSICKTKAEAERVKAEYEGKP